METLTYFPVVKSIISGENRSTSAHFRRFPALFPLIDLQLRGEIHRSFSTQGTFIAKMVDNERGYSFFLLPSVISDYD